MPTRALTCAGGGCPDAARCTEAGACMRLLGADPAAAGDTDKAFPPSKGARALVKAIEKIGQRESGGQNQGEIVRWSTRWLWEAEAADERAEAKRKGRNPEAAAQAKLQEYERLYKAGDMAWCAGFVGRCFVEAGVHVTPYWSAWCPALLMRLWSPLQHDHWEVQRWPTDVLPGDVLFFGKGPEGQRPIALDEAKGMRHVELAHHYDEASGVIYSVGGNTTRTTDRVALQDRVAAAAEIYARARAL